MKEWLALSLSPPVWCCISIQPPPRVPGPDIKAALLERRDSILSLYSPEYEGLLVRRLLPPTSLPTSLPLARGFSRASIWRFVLALGPLTFFFALASPPFFFFLRPPLVLSEFRAWSLHSAARCRRTRPSAEYSPLASLAPGVLLLVLRDLDCSTCMVVGATPRTDSCNFTIFPPLFLEVPFAPMPSESRKKRRSGVSLCRAQWFREWWLLFFVDWS